MLGLERGTPCFLNPLAGKRKTRPKPGSLVRSRRLENVQKYNLFNEIWPTICYIMGVRIQYVSELVSQKLEAIYPQKLRSVEILMEV